MPWSYGWLNSINVKMWVDSTAVSRYLETRDEPVVFLDCSETSFHRRRWYEALFFIVSNLARATGIQDKVDLYPEQAYDEKNSSQCFEADLKKIYTILHNKRLLLILDEIENITFEISPSEHWANESDYIFFWQSIRSIYQKNPNLFSFIIAGVNPRFC